MTKTCMQDYIILYGKCKGHFLNILFLFLKIRFFTSVLANINRFDDCSYCQQGIWQIQLHVRVLLKYMYMYVAVQLIQHISSIVLMLILAQLKTLPVLNWSANEVTLAKTIPLVQLPNLSKNKKTCYLNLTEIQVS